MGSLLNRFVYLAAALVLALSIGLHQYFRSVETSQLVDLEKRRGETNAKVVSNALWQHYQDFLLAASKRTDEDLKTSQEIKAIDASVRGLIAGSNIEKIKIFSTEARTIYSSLPQDIGKKKSAQVDFENVVQTGQSASAFEHRKEFQSLHGLKRNRHIVSVYVPVLGADHSVASVFEVYTDITDEFALLAQKRLVSSIVVMVLLSAAFGVLLLVLHRTGHTIEAQSRELEKFNEKLEAGIAESTYALLRHQNLLSELTGDDLFRNRDLNISLGRIDEVMAEGLLVERTSIWMLNQSETNFYCIDSFEAERRRHQDGPVVKLASCEGYWQAIRRQQVITTSDVHNDQIYSELQDLEEMTMHTSVMDTPIVMDSKVIGVLRAESSDPQFYWSPEAQVFALSLANLATLALERSEKRQLEKELVNANKHQEIVMWSI